MKVTSDSLFHFTNSFENLKSILLNKFRLTYCYENFYLNTEEYNNYFPMVTFCDLPLSLTKNHIKNYGSYAIGLSKDWGIKNKLNPVTYIEKNSLVAIDLKNSLNLLSNINKNIKKIENINQNIFFENTIADLLKLWSVNLNYFRYIKNYEGILKRKNKIKENNYRFYDEREWRYVPLFDDDRVLPCLTENKYKEYRGKTKYKPLIDEIILNFAANDIKYLIVKSNKDIPQLIRYIKKINNLINNSEEADILTTKIITIEQLNKDF